MPNQHTGKIKTLGERFWEKVNIGSKTECWVWQAGLDGHGYGYIWDDGKMLLSHRVSFYFHNGYWPNICCHNCDNPPCVNPYHLWNGTRKDNQRDMVRKGRQKLVPHKMPEPKRGEDNPNAKLTDGQVLQIKELYKTGKYSHRKLAAKFGIGKSVIHTVLTGQSWKHL